jgi:ribosome maturation factor RimP
VAEIVGPLLAARQLSLYDIEMRGGVLAVVVDRDGGVDLDTISDLTRDVSRALDADDPLPGHYTLEVSSPGLERRLRTPTHFRSAVGETVTVRRYEGDTTARVRGVLTAADDDGFSVRDDDLAEHRIRYGDVERARTVFAWGPPPRPSNKKAAKA